jgi:signal transduction histidine kinase
VNDFIIYFGLVDFILVALLSVSITGGIGWWLGRKKHEQFSGHTTKVLDALPYSVIILRAQTKGQPTMVMANTEAQHLWEEGESPVALTNRLGKLAHETQAHNGHHVHSFETPSGLKLQTRSAALDSAHTLFILEDLTARKQQERLYRNFIHNVSHELKTPLTIIQGHTAVLNDRRSDENMRQTSQRIVAQEATRLTQLVDNLLLLSRLEKPDFSIERRRVNLEALVEDAILQLSDLAETRNIVLDLQCEDVIPRIMADRAGLKQVLINLLDNSIKYNRDGGTVTIHINTDEAYVTLKVADTGEGIPAQDLPHIFEKLYRVERSNSRYVQGSGLGLSIVQQIVEKHTGHITVESKVDVGTTFTLHLPLTDQTIPAGK